MAKHKLKVKVVKQATFRLHPFRSALDTQEYTFAPGQIVEMTDQMEFNRICATGRVVALEGDRGEPPTHREGEGSWQGRPPRKPAAD
jgi:hypothetical protein